jgi:hypothetical protein
MAITFQQQGLTETLRAVRRVPAVLTKARVKAVNSTLNATKKFTVQAVYDDVTLKKADINKQLKVDKATQSRVNAVLTAKARPRLLARYSARIKTVPVKHPNRSKGFAKYGIPPGRKLAGVSVKVKRHGSRKMIKGFLIELKGSHATGLAVRTGRGMDAYEVKYGPSVYQVVRWHEADITAFIHQDLTRTLGAELSQALEIRPR